MKSTLLQCFYIPSCLGFVRHITQRSIIPSITNDDPTTTASTTEFHSPTRILREKQRETDSYETSDSSSKGIVGSLTNFVNFIKRGEEKEDEENLSLMDPPPATPQELLQLVKEDYTVKNYLWTGDIHLPAFEEGCTFTDPTLSFTGRQTFVNNVKNLVPIVNFLTKQQTTDNTNNASQPRSDLLDISLNEEEGYIQTRWNMVGDFVALPWKPAIDVIGRTKFWYRPTSDDDDGGYRIYFYDEEWEIEASTALLQLITPKGSIPNSTIQDQRK